MKALVINYLYEDLPEGYTVLATDWNNAMQLIKDTINAHATLLEQRSNNPYELIIGTSTNPWSEEDNTYQFTISQAMHNKGTRPRVNIYTTDGIELYDNPSINFDTGDVTIYSNSNDIIEVIIR